MPNWQPVVVPAMRRHNWHRDVPMRLHRCEESHPFLPPKSELRCNGCGVTFGDREWARMGNPGLPDLLMLDYSVWRRDA